MRTSPLDQIPVCGLRLLSCVNRHPVKQELCHTPTSDHRSFFLYVNHHAKVQDFYLENELAASLCNKSTTCRTVYVVTDLLGREVRIWSVAASWAPLGNRVHFSNY